MGAALIDKKDFPMLIGGEWVCTRPLRTLTLPYDGTPVGEVYEADAVKADRAVAALHAGAAAVAKLPQYERAELLDRRRAALRGVRNGMPFRGLEGVEVVSCFVVRRFGCEREHFRQSRT
jgi:hypothetical protein